MGVFGPALCHRNLNIGRHNIHYGLPLRFLRGGETRYRATDFPRAAPREFLTPTNNPPKFVLRVVKVAFAQVGSRTIATPQV